MLKEVINAQELLNKYNAMPIEEIVSLYEKETGKTVPQKEINNWKFTGLNNVYFIIMVLTNL